MDERFLKKMKAQSDAQNERDVLRMASQTLDSTQQEKLQTLLRDKQALTSLLQSEKAQALLRQLQK